MRPLNSNAGRHWGMLGLILLGALALRTVAVERQGLWFDEGLTLVISNFTPWEMLAAPADETPALYYILHGLLIGPHAPLWAIRAISVVCGVASVGMAYVLGRLSFGRDVGLGAAALLAVWTSHVDYSQEARAYSLLFLLTMIASAGVLIYARATRPGEARDERLARVGLAAFAAGDVLAFYTHFISIFWIAATSLLMIALAIRARTRRSLAEVAAVLLAMALLAAPGVVRMAVMMRLDTFVWLRQRPWHVAARQMIDVFGPMGLWINDWHASTDRARVVIVAALAVAAAAFAWPRRCKLMAVMAERPVSMAVIAAYLAMPPIIWAAGRLGTPLFMSRVILFAIPGAMLLLALLGAGRPLLTGGMVVAFTASTLLYGIVRNKEDWRGAARTLGRLAGPGDVVLVCAKGGYPALRYHMDRPAGGSVLIPVDGELMEIERSLGSDGSWDQTYFEAVTAEMVRRRGFPVHGERFRVQSADLRLEPGRSLWVVDSNCQPGDKPLLDSMTASVAADSKLVFRQAQRASARQPDVRVYRRVAAQPVRFRVVRLKPPAG